MRGRNLSLALLLTSALLLLNGCVTAPVLELYGARVQGLSPQGVNLALTLKVNNQNSYDVKVRNVRANVSLAGQYNLPPLQYNPETWLPSGQSTLIAVPMVIPWTLLQPLVFTSLGSDKIPYHLHGFADVTATRLLQMQVNDYALDQDGVFSRGDLLAAASHGVLGKAALARTGIFAELTLPPEEASQRPLLALNPNP